MVGKIGMPDHSEQLNRAAECLALAQKTDDAATRVTLLTMAQKWLDLANGALSRLNFNAVMQDINDREMSKR
jgi:hypothetical protein